MINYDKLRENLNDFKLRNFIGGFVEMVAWSCWLYAITYIRALMVLVIMLVLKDFNIIDPVIHAKFIKVYFFLSFFYISEPVITQMNKLIKKYKLKGVKK